MRVLARDIVSPKIKATALAEGFVVIESETMGLGASIDIDSSLRVELTYSP